MRSSISSCIKAFISRLDCNELFTSSELRVFGNRAAIDQCIFRLIQKEYIKRVGNGVFVKCDRHGRFKDVSQEEVLKKKAAVNGMRLVVHRTADEVLYLTNGRSSTITINGEKIKLKKACNRKLNLGESKAASLLRQLWFEGKVQAQTIWEDENKIGRFQKLEATDRIELREAAPLIPDWLNNAVNKKKFGKYLNKEDKTIRLLQLRRG